MQYLSTREHGDDQVLLQLGANHVRNDSHARTEVELRDRLIDLVSVRKLAAQARSSVLSFQEVPAKNLPSKVSAFS